MKLIKTIEILHAEARHIIESGRKAAYHAVNTSMVKTYWEIGQLIVEEEQQGEERANGCYHLNVIKHVNLFF